MSWSESIDWFLAQARVEMGYSSLTLEAYAHELTRYVQYLEREHRLTHVAQVETTHLHGFMIELIETYRLGEFSQARALSALRTFHRYAVREEWASENPAALLDLPRLHRKLPAILGVEEVEQLIAACDEPGPLGLRNTAMVELLYASGLRVSELVHVQPIHLDLEEGWVRVMGKGRRERITPMGQPAIDALRTYLSEGRPQLVGEGQQIPYVFLNRYGNRLSRQSVFLLIQQKAREAGITKTVGPHTLRHCFATHLIENGADLVAVRDLLGHASIATTEIYVHTDARRLREVVDRYHPLSHSAYPRG